MKRALVTVALLCSAGVPAQASPRSAETARLRVSFGMSEYFGTCEGRDLFSGVITLTNPAFGAKSVAVGNASTAHTVGTGRKVHDPCAGWTPGDPDFDNIVTEELWYDLEVSADADPGLSRILLQGVDLHVATLDAGFADEDYNEVPEPSMGFRFVTSTFIDPLLQDPGIYAPAYAEGSLLLELRAVPRYFIGVGHGAVAMNYSAATGSFPNFISDIDKAAGKGITTHEIPDVWDVYLTVRLEAGAYAAVPEPATWAMLIVGFGLVGTTIRRRRDLSIGTTGVQTVR